MIKFIKSVHSEEGVDKMVKQISSALVQGKKVLWLICGGSNIPIAAQIMAEIRISVSEETLQSLVVAQTDERYGPVGHSDSNWKQMLDAGFNFSGMRTVPILNGKSLEDTVTDYASAIVPIIEDVIAEDGLIVGQFGMGNDGHIAGILPHTVAVNDPKPVSGYKTESFTRVTLTPSILVKISTAYVFVFGNAKEPAVQRLVNESLSIEEEPAQILKNLKEVYFYSDVIEPIKQ